VLAEVIAARSIASLVVDAVATRRTCAGSFCCCSSCICGGAVPRAATTVFTGVLVVSLSVGLEASFGPRV
jgi:hypothetical protein